MVVSEYLIVNLAQSSYNQVMVHYEGTKVTYQCLMLVTCSVTISYFNETITRYIVRDTILPLLYYFVKCDYECRRYEGLCLASNMAEVVGTVVGVVVDYAFDQLR